MFEAMVRRGSVRGAAGDQHVTPGAVSQQIRRLEAELGVLLFERSSRAMKPTPAAVILANEVSAAFAAISKAVANVRTPHAGQPLRVSTLPSIATRIIVPRLSSFRRRAPTIPLSFTYVHRIAEYSIEDADVLLCTVDGRYAGPGTAMRLFSGMVRPVCSPAYLKEKGPFLTAEDIYKADLLHDFDTSPWRSWLSKAGLALRNDLPGDVYEDFGLLGLAAVTGQGIALCPVRLIEQELAQGDLIVISDTAFFQERAYYAVLPDKPRADAEVFVQWLLELVGEE